MRQRFISGPTMHQQNTASLWISFNGTGTVAINDSFGVSSITDNGVGNYTVNLIQVMQSTWSFGTMMRRTSAGIAGYSTGNNAAGSLTTTSLGLRCFLPDNTAHDPDLVTMVGVGRPG